MPFGKFKVNCLAWIPAYAGMTVILSLAAPANAQTNSAPALNIAAVVGDQVITSFDVDARIKFIVATTKISNSPEMLKNIRPQVIRTLTDEVLERQIAQKNGIKIEDAEITKAIATIEAQREMPAGTIANMLKTKNVPEKTFTDQVRAQLSWNKWLGKNVLSDVKVGDDEIALAKSRLAAQPNVKEMEIAVIDLPVDKKKAEAEVKKAADNLVAELRKGAKFEELARQFSAGGNKSFWVRPQELDPSIAKVLISKKEGEITTPIRTALGFSIIKVLNVRAVENAAKDEEITLKEILMKLKPDAKDTEKTTLLQIAEQVSKNAGTCEEKNVAGIADLSGADIEVNFRTTPASELPPAIKIISNNLKIGDISTPFASEDGIRLYMLCGKKETDGVSSNQIREALMRQKFELEAQKNLRNLRRDTFIEVRE